MKRVLIYALFRFVCFLYVFIVRFTVYLTLHLCLLTTVTADNTTAQVKFTLPRLRGQVNLPV